MRVVYLFIFILAGHLPAIALKPVMRDCILFDLSFWQKELHLSKGQQWEISCINNDLHNTLYEMPTTQPIDEEFVQMLLGVWRYSMYDVLSAKQKKKWRKIIGRYYGEKQPDCQYLN